MLLLALDNVKKTYRSPDGTICTPVNVRRFELERGEQVALSGGSGSGKTTLLNLIAGILTPDRGSILFDGTELARLSEHERDRMRATAIGYVFQTFNLLQGMTALENVLIAMQFGEGADRVRAAELLIRVGLADRLHHRPDMLSSGQQQRVAIARALANRPKLVLADEPTGSLDERLSSETVALIRGLCRENGTALIFATHDGAIMRAFEKTVGPSGEANA